jgi:hypothetical protein
MIKPNDLSTLNSKNIFLSYEGTKDKNVLFIGSCRITPLMFYFNQMFPEYNVFGIYIPYWSDTSTLSRDVIQKILNNTYLLVTETVRSYNILNTDRSEKNNFFETFDVRASEIRIANLELRMYIYDLINTFNLKIEESFEHFEESKTRLKSSLKSKDQEFIWEFIDSNLENLKLFSTHNHPTRILSILTFAKIANIIGGSLDFEFIKKISKYDFLESNSTPITSIDIEKYKLKFKTKIFENNIVYDKSFLYNAPDEEKIVCDSTIEKILEAQSKME